MTETVLGPADAGFRPAEGIRVRAVAGELVAEVTRCDRTRILIEESGLAGSVAELAAGGAFLILDGNVRGAWAGALDPVLDQGRYLVLEPGEAHKSVRTVERIVTGLHERGVDRQTTLVAVGGGVTCDVVGLTAALYFRGVSAVYVPTTLLAMIDAAIGGKTGVNHPRQKNLLGTFTHPAEVRIHLDALATLGPEELVPAFGEALKIAIVDEPELFELLEAGLGAPADPAVLARVVRTCVEAKLRLLEANCFERDLQRALNLGHTVAHPLEDITGFRVRHGTAVGIGIAVAAHISHRRGLLGAEVFERILAAMRRLGLPLMDTDFDPAELQNRVSGLKLQRGGSSLHYVLPTAIGKTTFTDTVSPAELAAAVHDLRALQERPR